MVDTSVLVGELLRASGRDRLGDHRLGLFLPERMWGETKVEIPRRINLFAKRPGLDPTLRAQLSAACVAAVEADITIIDEAIDGAIEDEARARSLRDPNDWPAVAAALALACGVWTNDNDFLGTGVPTWTTESLTAWLERQAKPTDD